MQPVLQALVQYLNLVKDLLQPLLSALVPAFTNEWQSIVYRETYFEMLNNQFDSGVYVTALTYFSVSEYRYFLIIIQLSDCE